MLLYELIQRLRKSGYFLCQKILVMLTSIQLLLIRMELCGLLDKVGFMVDWILLWDKWRFLMHPVAEGLMVSQRLLMAPFITRHYLEAISLVLIWKPGLLL